MRIFKVDSKRLPDGILFIFINLKINQMHQFRPMFQYRPLI
jgi:hypothetical protein